MHTSDSSRQRSTRKNMISYTALTSISALTVFAVIAACTGSQAKAKPNFITKPAPRPGVVAKIGSEEITEEALIGDDKMDFFELKKREHDLRMERLNRLVIEKLVGAEAKKANMPLEEFINKKVVGGDIKISEKDFNKFVAEKHIPESQLNPQIKERINSYLQQSKRQDAIQAYVAKVTKNNPVEVYFQKPKMAVAVEAGNGPSEGGKADAPVTMIVFSDFQCPFCSRGAESVAAVKKKYGSKVRIVFRHFPLPMHKDARPAAEASMCVNDQGGDKFWKFHDKAFANQDKLDAPNLEKYAKEAGADVKKFQECLAAKKFAAAVQTDMEYGEKVGVKSTPTFFVNGELISGAVPIEQFSEVIDEALEEKK